MTKLENELSFFTFPKVHSGSVANPLIVKIEKQNQLLLCRDNPTLDLHPKGLLGLDGMQRASYVGTHASTPSVQERGVQTAVVSHANGSHSAPSQCKLPWRATTQCSRDNFWGLAQENGNALNHHRKPVSSPSYIRNYFSTLWRKKGTCHPQFSGHCHDIQERSS